MSAVPQFSMRDLLNAGVHFGHKTLRWNPKMQPFIYGSRNNIHILDLQQTVPMLHHALKAVRDVVAKNGRVLFVGTKRQAGSIIAEEAKRCGQYYVNHRWLGGMLTNWNTVSVSIKTLRSLEEQLQDKELQISKKERLTLDRHREKLELSLGGIREMGGLPNIIFIVDTNKEKIAVQEASKLGIPIIAVVDTNSDPDGITYPIPGNDDATRAIQLYCKLVADAALSGLGQSLAKSGRDLGASADGIKEVIPVDISKLKKSAKKAPEAAIAAAAAPKEAEPAPAAKAPEAPKAKAAPAPAKAKAEKPAEKKEAAKKEKAASEKKAAPKAKKAGGAAADKKKKA